MKALIRAISLLLLSPAFALGANLTQYVNVTGSCSFNGNGAAANCAASGGASGAFNSWANWEGQHTNLDSGNNTMTVNFTGTITSAITLDGWTTSTTDTLTMVGLIVDSNDYGDIVTISDSNVTCRQCAFTKGGTTSARILKLNNPGFTLERSIVASDSDHVNDGGTNMITIASSGAGGTTTFRNNFIYDSVTTCIVIGLGNGETLNFSNNTVEGCGADGIVIEIDSGSGQTINFYNNLAYNNGGADLTDNSDISYSPGAATSNTGTNITQDATSPNAGNRSKTITFVNAAADNYHLDPGETDAIDQGTDRSAAGYSNDYDNDTRTGSWDIGADEVVSSSIASPALKVGGYLP